MKYYVLKNSIIVNLGNGITHTISSEDYRYEKIKKLIEEKDFDSIGGAVDPSVNLNKDGFLVKDGLVCYKDEPIPSILGNQFLTLKEDNWVFKSLFNFWYNIKTRVDNDCASEMLRALVDKHAYPITEDGFYLVYFDTHINQSESILNKNNINQSNINFYNVAGCPPKYVEFFNKRKSLDDILVETFGFSAKKLKKLATQNVFKPENNFFDYRFLLIGEALKEVLQPDNIYGLIEENTFKIPQNNIGLDAFVKINEFLKDFSVEKTGKYSQKKIINLLRSAENETVLIDIAEYYSAVKVGLNFNIQNIEIASSCKEIYDYLRREYMRLKDPAISLSMETNFEKIFSLHDIEVSNMRFLIPNTSHDLKEWSNIMGNCIATYADKVKNGQTAVFALMDCATNEMMYNVEVSRGRIIQFVKKNNEPAKGDQHKSIINFLKEKEILFKE
jgi:hypothetical protein